MTSITRRFIERAMGFVPDAREHVFTGVNPLQQLLRPERAAQYAAMPGSFFGLAT